MGADDLARPPPLAHRVLLGIAAAAAGFLLTRFLMTHAPFVALILLVIMTGGAVPTITANRTGLLFALLAGSVLGIGVALVPWIL